MQDGRNEKTLLLLFCPRAVLPESNYHPDFGFMGAPKLSLSIIHDSRNVLPFPGEAIQGGLVHGVQRNDHSRRIVLLARLFGCVDQTKWLEINNIIRCYRSACFRCLGIGCSIARSFLAFSTTSRGPSRLKSSIQPSPNCYCRPTQLFLCHHRLQDIPCF